MTARRNAGVHRLKLGDSRAPAWGEFVDTIFAIAPCPRFLMVELAHPLILSAHKPERRLNVAVVGRAQRVVHGFLLDRSVSGGSR